LFRAPHFVRLVDIDQRHFINACRHGLVHLTWDRVTVRFTRDEFRRLARLLARSSVSQAGPLRDGELEAACHANRECELRLGSLTLTLSLEEYQALGRAAQEAVVQLDKILDAGMWDEREADATESAPPTSILERFRQHRFSDN
jgi:hypothetical protein